MFQWDKIVLLDFRHRATFLFLWWCPELTALEYRFSWILSRLNKDPTEVGTLNTACLR
jgi:hypothetical protein